MIVSGTAPNITIRATSIDITPETPCGLGGYADPRPWARIADGLEANVVLFDDGARALFLISLDTLYIGRDLLAFLQETVGTSMPDRAVDLVTFASHTHFAPMLDPAKPRLGAVDPAYAALVRARLANAIGRAVAAPGEPARFRAVGGETDLTVNRRLTETRRTLRSRLRARTETFLAPNPDGYVDPRLRIKLVESADGAPRAALVHFGCHPTSFPDKEAVSADYIGVIRDAVRRVTGACIPVVFLQGCAGDVRTSIRGETGALRTLAIGPHFGPISMAQWRAWADTLDGFVAGLLRDPAPAQALAGRIGVNRRRMDLEEIVEGAGDERALEVIGARIGDGIGLLSFNAEPLARWTLCFPSELLVAGYSGDCFGYLPRQSDVAAGGYEVDGHQPFLDLPAARWREGFEGRIAAAAGALLQAGA